MRYPIGTGKPAITSFLGPILLAVVTAACQPSPPAGATPVAEARVSREPAEVAVFLDAYAQGDDEEADRLASPLYLAEWSRRGLSLQDRLALHREGDRGIQFAFVGGVYNSSGFARYLFLAAPTPGPSTLDKSVSIWRVDVDPRERVVWAEAVWWFDRTASVSTLVGGETKPESFPSDARHTRDPTLLFRVQSDTSPESYNLVRINNSTPMPGRTSAGDVAVFYATDKDGNFRPSTWSYGQFIAPSRAHDQPLLTPVPHVPSALDGLRADYLAFLAQETAPIDLRSITSTTTG
jgi:hypothetical protein